MDFVLWVCRVMHVMAVVVWIGGLIFLNAVLNPILVHQKETRSTVALNVLSRFQPFVWWSFWSLLVTGFLLMLLSPRFLWLDFSTPWSKLLAVKIAAFALLGFFGWQQGTILRRLLESSGGQEETFEGWRLGYEKLVKRSIGTGLLALLAAGAMMVV